MIFLGDIIFFEIKKEELCGMYIGNKEIIYVDKRGFVRFVNLEKVIIKRIRRVELTLESFSYLYENVISCFLRYKILRKIFPQKTNFKNSTFIGFLLNSIHILIKFDFNKIEYKDLLFSAKLYDVK